MLSHFTYLKDAGFDFPAPMQTMIILCKLPPTMEVVPQILSQTSPDEIKNLKLEGIVKAAMLSFEQKGATRGSGKGPQANKLSAVKRKPADPKFAQQQQGGSNSSVSRNAPAQGQGGRTRRGSKKAHARHEAAQQAAFTTYVHYDGPEPTVDPRALAHTPGATNFGPPAFDNTIKAFDLAHHLGVEPSCQTIHTLDHIVLTASASLDQPEAGPSLLKRPRLEECITMYEEDAISLRDDEPIAHKLFTDDEFDEVHAMVLDRYNAMSMAMDVEASLFRQVPSARVLTDTDTLPLHVLYTPALYIVSSHYNLSCRVSSNAYICLCSNNACCAGCKGKMVNDSELSGAFWLLDSGASHHFTGDIGDFASYNTLKRAHYAKTANGVALIAGIGTVLLQCLDHNSGDEKVITLTQVLHMPGATAHLISMGKMLQHNYRVTGNKRGISLTHKAERLWFGPDPEDDHNIIIFGIRSIPIIRSNYIASVSKVNYDIMHRRFGHPLKEVLQHTQKHTQRFPEIHFPTEDCVCPGCALGKMPNQAFPENKRHASKPFELVHSDLKSFPVTSYQKFQYVITFYDDFTSHAWTMPLCSKAAVIMAAKDFLEMVHVQHNVHIIGWMSNAGGEYKSDLFDRALLEKGIKIYQSAPRTPMQNGHAERLGRTLMDKAESMRHQACIPDPWWEFVFAHATHIYNRTPVARLRWCTPHEMLKGEMPNIDHLGVFGCGAFVYLPATARANKMAPKSELMTYVSVAPGNEHNFLFMHSTNAVFTPAHAVFDECHFPHCPKNRHKPLENPFGRANPKPTTDRPGNPPEDIDSDDDVEHDHGYPHPQAQDDDPKRKEPQAPEEEPNQINPPCTPSPVPPPAPRTPSPERNLPPLALQRPGRAECHQNAPCPPAVNIPARPQHEHRVPLCPGNMYREQQHPVEQLRDIESALRWRETVGEASRPPQPDTPDHVPGGFPDTSAMPSEEDVQKMCEEGGANLVRFMMGKALTTREPQYESVRNWSYKDIARLPQAEQKLWRLACQEELDVLRKRKVLLVDCPRDRKVIKN